MFGGRRRRGVPCLRLQDGDLVGEVAIRCTTHVRQEGVGERVLRLLMIVRRSLGHWLVQLLIFCQGLCDESRLYELLLL